MTLPPITDCNDRPLKVGDKVSPYGFSTEIGEITRVFDCDENGWAVEVDWLDDELECFYPYPPNMRKAWAGDQTLRCDDLELSQEAVGDV